MKKRIIFIFLLVVCVYGNLWGQVDGWRNLFNGENLENWDKYVGPVFPGHEDLGKVATADNVFSVINVNGLKMIRISGEVHGSLATKESFGNYHLQIVYKWGDEVTLERNSGLLYHSYGPLGAAFGTWMASVECQMKHDAAGDTFLMVDSVECTSQVKHTDGEDIYTPDGAQVQFGQRFGKRMIRNKQHAENPLGEWNILELYCLGQTAVHVVNGVKVMVNDNIRMRDRIPQRLTSGKLQLQSEGAELFIKDIKIKPIEVIPYELMK
ncbi:DUF1080 domain-containing protein [Bacteroides thetaiotaomicron]|uniref:DUF1080 domain-containing protein n=1 Tax=Bacteroides thetaiotaomicron TaxID=818 RepID=A0A7J5JQH8_BACT4|nr:DUF1080 domain-containing protein [Bacteroides thetaiotaomicron]KAB4416118.1 DUF1080 domain-containing protein [Bacteroides thetaiotaomicron]KAB4431732.1 DUF1080 domain-containing protein [Bacteroides thetaiotaomicron]KAB4438078.1 DUF1080 domain-containing protein [Bacteroides thetaiotaomicron]KAB4440848.1 DUF1080 domain-containing protein [Bacteroides thetaiotaomicron]KAB4453643.1 DUF1080 domain-containing protein [Bacteroides thetaiotaomicron]